MCLKCPCCHVSGKKYAQKQQNAEDSAVLIYIEAVIRKKGNNSYPYIGFQFINGVICRVFA